MRKRGQITVFIIIGLLILVFAGIFLFVREQQLEQDIPEVVPEKVFPLKVYTDQCVKQVSQQAIDLLGTQGGYIFIPEYINLDPRASLPITGNLNQASIKIPYWYYEGKNRIPTIEEMQEQAEFYINDNIVTCLKEYGAFANEFEVNPEGDISSRVRIGQEAVEVRVTYPIAINSLGEEDITRISQFTAALDVKLGKAHQLAKEILKAENEQAFLEQTTIDLMAMGTEVPFTDVVFECGKLVWLKPEVERDIKDLIFYNLPKIKFKNTDHEPLAAPLWKYNELRRYSAFDIREGNLPEDVPPDAYDFFHFFWDTTTNDYSDLKADLYFQRDWPFEMNVRPSKGNVMSSSFGRGAKQYLSFLCVNAYHFTYDLVFPVEIILRDPQAYSGQGFTFSYAFPVLISQNQGDRSNFPIALFESPEGTDLNACSSREDKITLISAKDRYTFEDIKDVNITFDCMNTVQCSLGSTEPDAGVYRVSTPIPDFCAPGSIIAEHEDYLSATQEIDRSQQVIQVQMTPLNKLDLRIVKRRLSGETLQNAEPLERDEKAIIFLSSDQLPDYSFFSRYPFEDNTPDFMKELPLPLDDITYNLDIILLRHDNIMIGGFRGNWSVNRADAEGRSRVTFTALEKIPHPESDEDIVEMFTTMEDEQYLQLIQPEFS